MQQNFKKIFNRINKFDLDFLKKIENAYIASSNVQNIHAWYSRLAHLTSSFSGDSAAYRQVEDHIFELKIIFYLNTNFYGSELIYEPSGINPEGKNCDILAIRNGKRFLIEIKSFHPEFSAKKIPTEYIACNNIVNMDGESYHTYQASYGHLIDVAYETEKKIANYSLDATTVLAVSDNFHFNAEFLRDFVFIYRNRCPRPDDPLGKIVMHNLRSRGEFSGSINEFWIMPFPQQCFSFREEKLPTVIEFIEDNDRGILI